MSVKEKPLFKATDELGPLPGFFFGSPFFAGFSAIVMCAIFGGFAASFVGAGHGNADPEKLFVAALVGAGFTLAFSAVILFVIFVSAVNNNDKDERKVRLDFAFGGIVALVAIVTTAALGSKPLYDWLETQPPIVYTN